ncbi:F0F1 ATP synthase subunit gamma [Paraburkholderia sp. CNPSo 3274]|uniref:F0F1 ATP synthase subunit gamma n=1 Tax=Paraburkholderia sp. CNPSo 3274 TaxID=2940932 RepID=UPI0020B7B607|nr:FoF1 ATP synthase subunit gamma [Paraburkholderia sp. CNPSo 3274]MCP3710086.1 F0F1 ATP synthase subunit gamma [Paraburkholderia sp. CNPSo 3274]
MSGKLGEIEARIGATHQLEAVVGAMRGIAAARSRDAHARLAGIRACAAAAGTAIGDVLAFDPSSASTKTMKEDDGAEVCIVIGAEQGFVGGLNDRIADAAMHRPGERDSQWLLVGTRLVSACAERGLAEGWSAPMAAHPAAVPHLAARVSDALCARLADGERATRVMVTHALPGESRLRVAQRTLIPFDFARFHVTPRALPPLVNMPPARLLARLVELYVSLELCEALMLAFAAENEARVRAMLAARTNVQERLSSLSQQYRAMRQDEVTAEIVELTTARAAARRAMD